jgi:hypothetical protein
VDSAKRAGIAILGLLFRLIGTFPENFKFKCA